MSEGKLTVDFVLVLHDQEGVIVEVTEECNARFYSPVVLVLVEKWVSVEELGIDNH